MIYGLRKREPKSMIGLCPLLVIFSPVSEDEDYNEAGGKNYNLLAKCINASVITQNYRYNIRSVRVFVGVLDVVISRNGCAGKAAFLMHLVIRISTIGQIRNCKKQNECKSDN